MLEKELKILKEKHDKNIHLAYTNIINSNSDNYKDEIQLLLKYFNINYKPEAGDLEGQLKEISIKFDINSRWVNLNEDWNKNSLLPLIVKRGNELKTILPTVRGRCKFYDNNKLRSISDRDVAEFEESGLCFYKGFSTNEITKWQLIKFMLNSVSVKEYLIVFAFMIAVMSFSTVMPKAQYYIFNHLIPAGTRSDILPIGFLLTGIIIISFVIYVLRGIVAANIPNTISVYIQGAVISRLLRLKSSFFTNHKAGSLSNGIIKISKISDIFSGDTISAFMSFILSIIYAYEINIYAKEFMFFVYIAFLIVIVFTVVNALFYNRYNGRFSKSANEMTGFVYELFGGMENVKLNNSSSVMFNRWSEYYSEVLRAHKEPIFIKYYSSIYGLVISALTFVIFRIGMNTQASAADFITFMSLYGLFVGSVGGIAKVLNSFAVFNSSYNGLRDFFMADVEERSNKADIKNIKGNIEVSNISFKYDSNYILDDISFSIAKGQKIGITGKSGCGKSTLVKLLLGFEQPEKGRIFIDNTDLNEINLSSFRQKLGVVLQSSKLIPGDIFSNIVLTRPNSTYDEVMEAVERVGLKEDIDNMPMGLYTFVSDDNLTISLGQKQRILLARAILGKPSIIILDEATNALDNITQANVSRYIEALDVTTIIVAHRLSTIKYCDNIIVLDEGKIAEEGKYEDLINRKGVFYNLVKNQM